MLRTLRALFCAHNSVALTVEGAAAIARDGRTEFVVEVRCKRCDGFVHASLDATAALRAALQSR